MALAFGGVTGELVAMTKAFGPVGAAAVALREIVTVGAEFQQQMAQVGAVTGLMGTEFEKVTQSAREFASTTTFTATEAADALYALGSAGISTAVGLSNTLDPALKLAGATLSETKLATEALTGTMAAFRLDTSEATHVADVFAGAIASSPANMERLSAALSQANAVAAAFGVSMEDTVESIAAFHTVGIRGSEAGTAFRQAMMELTKAADSSNTAIGQALAGWDPAITGMTGAIQMLEAAGITGAEVMSEFGRRGGKAVAAQLALGSEAISDLGDKIVTTGDVQKMYTRQTGTLSAQFKIMKSQLQEVALTIFDKLAPALNAAVKTVVSLIEKSRAWGTANAETITSLKNIALVLVGTGGIILALGGLTTGITAAITAIKLLGTSSVVLQGVTTGVSAALAASGAELVKYKSVGFAAAAGQASIGDAFRTSGIKVAAFSTTAKSTASLASNSFKLIGKSFGLVGNNILILLAAITGYMVGKFLRSFGPIEKSADAIAEGFMRLTGSFEELKRPAGESGEAMRKTRLEMEAVAAAAAELYEEAFVPLTRITFDWNKIAKAAGLSMDFATNSAAQLKQNMAELEGIIALINPETGELSEKGAILSAAFRDAAQSAATWADTLRESNVHSIDQTLAMEDLRIAFDNYSKAATAAAEAFDSKDLEKIAAAAMEAADANDGLQKSYDQLSVNLADVKIHAAGMINELKKQKDAGEFTDAQVGSARELAIAYQDLAREAAEFNKALKTEDPKKINQALQEYQASITAVTQAQESHNKTLGETETAIDKVSKKIIDLAAFKIDINLPKMSKWEIEQWGQFVKALNGLKATSFKIGVGIPKMRRTMLDDWKEFFVAINRLKSKDYKMDIKLPKLTKNQSEIWIDFFKALSGAGDLDLGDVSGADFNKSLNSIAASLVSLVKMKGIIWA